MAIPKHIIRKIEDATCETCIYSRPSDPQREIPRYYAWCIREHDEGHNVENTDWCGKGLWMIKMHHRGEEPYVLADLYYAFNRKK